MVGPDRAAGELFQQRSWACVPGVFGDVHVGRLLAAHPGRLDVVREHVLALVG